MGWMYKKGPAIPERSTWTRPAALAKCPISPSVTDTDLLAEYPDLATHWGNGRTNAQTLSIRLE